MVSGEHKNGETPGQVLKKRMETDTHAPMENIPPMVQPEPAPTLAPGALPGVTLLAARYRTQRFSRHTHDDYALGVIEDGALGFDYRGATAIL